LASEEFEDLRYLKRSKLPWIRKPGLLHTLRFWQACYAANIARFDRQLNVLLEALESSRSASACSSWWSSF